MRRRMAGIGGFGRRWIGWWGRIFVGSGRIDAGIWEDYGK